ncbi:MAG: TonB family protein [Bacteroidales bacterium]|nr:TonB family protein [Bacteroidales bacterium]
MKIDRKGLIGTVVIHSILLAIFLFAAFTTPLPLPAEEGIMINFGDIKYASGPSEPKKVEKKKEQPKPQPPKVKKTTPVKQKIATQDFEDAAAVNTAKEKPKPVETKKKVEKKEPVKEEPKEKPRVVNKKALWSAKKNNTTYTGSEGNATGSGNMGNPTGDENAINRNEGISEGTGISASLAGRSPVALPKPSFNVQEEGKVVVEVKVDRDGNVIEANPGAKGSTTWNSALLAAAKRAALRSKFTSKSDAPFHQKGTITYVFKLR